ncbi:hypothetical protein ACFV4F_17315 [Kitasatospora sp. NPDC059722]|uniref:hypothetical protein n=1 Tax=Kitasatospora sp. NPDC059722 TaxID=3346925 RepID=UPI0036BEFCE4
MDNYQLTPAGRRAVTEAYDVFRRFHGPFITSIAAEMLPDLKADAEQGRLVVFLGRDGHSFAAATRALDPEFFARSCREVVLSRVIAEAALQDLEQNRGKQFPDIEGFRGTRDRVAPDSVLGAHRALTDYLDDENVPVGIPGSRLTLVDSSYKGTVQELLAAAYPRTDFEGRYAFFGAAPDDPNPDRKIGYVVHLKAEQTGEGKGYPFDDLHPNQGWTFASKEPINVIEHTLHSPMDTPRSVTVDGPQQRRQRDIPDALRGFNPSLVPERFRDPLTREAIKAAALVAVYDAAAERAALGPMDATWLAERMRERAQFTDAVRQWVDRSPEVDPQLKTVLDCVVRRVDHPVYSELRDHLAEQGISEEQAAQAWSRMEQFPDRASRADFVRASTRSLPYGDVPDADLGAALGRAVGEAEGARQQAVAAEGRVGEIAAALAPGGEVEQRVAARAGQVDAILQSRTDAARVDRLAGDLDRARQQAGAVEERLAERGGFGRPAVRGADREALEQQLAQLGVAVQTGDQRLAAAREQLQVSVRAAGDASEHDAVLAAWQQAGGNPAEVLARTTAARERGLESARSQAQEAHQRAAGLETAVGQIQQELSRRAAQPPAQRLAEDAQRVQAAQRAAVPHQQVQQPAPVQSRTQHRSGSAR